MAAQGQIQIISGVDPAQLVQDEFIGSGIRVKDIRFKGADEAIGKFTYKGEALGLKGGVILSTGRAADAAGPNNSAKTGTAFNKPGDLTLKRYNMGGSYDAAVLEFDFMGNKDSVTFSFVFATEEYNDFVGTEYNDVFAAFIIGPGFRSGKNLASLPGTANTPITINTVNGRDNNHLYVDNNQFNKVGQPVQTKLDNLNPELHQNIQYDGMTVALNVGCRIVPRQVYHMRITITDVDDDMYDSAILLGKSSFQSLEQAKHEKRRIALAERRRADSTGMVMALQDSLRNLVADSLSPVLGSEQAQAEAADLVFHSPEEYTFQGDTFYYDNLPDLGRLKEAYQYEIDQKEEQEKITQNETPDDSPPRGDTGEKKENPSKAHKSEDLFKRDPFSGASRKPGQPVREYPNPYYKTPGTGNEGEYKLVIDFGRGEYILQDTTKDKLRALAAFMEKNPKTRAGIYSHKNVGEQAEEDKVRKLRATLTEYFLVGEGVDPDRIFQNGFSFVSPEENQKICPHRIEIWMKKVTSP